MVIPAGSLKDEPDVAERFMIFTLEQPSWATEFEHVKQFVRFPD